MEKTYGSFLSISLQVTKLKEMLSLPAPMQPRIGRVKIHKDPFMSALCKV